MAEREHLRLDMIAAHLGVRKATLARDLLGAATQEALDTLKFSNVQEEADFWQDLGERENEMMEAQIQDHVDYWEQQ